MQILLVNQNWFATEFKAAGHQVLSCGMDSNVDIRLPCPIVHYQAATELAGGNFKPDLIVVYDNSAPLLLAGIEDASCPTIFYSVDTHHHLELHQKIAGMFDRVLVAQKDYIQKFDGWADSVEWFPLWASREVQQQQEKENTAVFVGTLDPRLNRERVTFFEELQKRTEMLCTSGAWWEIFPRSQIVINQTVKGDLNFRVFEALASGAMLLTEESGNGLTDLFVPGKHLVTYPKSDVDTAAEKIEYYLNHIEEAREIARQGYEEVLKNHSAERRAARILEIADSIGSASRARKYLSALSNQVQLSQRLKYTDPAFANRALISAIRYADKAIDAKEHLNERTAVDIIYACMEADIVFNVAVGTPLLERCSEAYPESAPLLLASVRSLLNQGESSRASAIMESVGYSNSEEGFANAEQFIQTILSEGYRLGSISAEHIER